MAANEISEELQPQMKPLQNLLPALLHGKIWLAEFDRFSPVVTRGNPTYKEGRNRFLLLATASVCQGKMIGLMVARVCCSTNEWTKGQRDPNCA
jgi:hypothetical protein